MSPSRQRAAQANAAGSSAEAPAEREEAVFKALADATRRTLLDVLRSGPRTTGDLCALFEMTRFGVMKHLGQLEAAGLVIVERRGRERWNHLNAAPIREIYRRWIRPFEEHDADRLLRLKHVAETTQPAPKRRSSKKNEKRSTK